MHGFGPLVLVAQICPIRRPRANRESLTGKCRRHGGVGNRPEGINHAAIPGTWRIGLAMKLSGPDIQILQMYSALLHKSGWIPWVASKVSVRLHEQTHTPDLPHDELARLHLCPEAAGFASDLV